MEETIAERLKRIIEAKNMSVGMLSIKSGLSRQAIYKIINGERKHPSAQTLVSLADALGVNVAEIAGQEVTKLPPSVLLSDAGVMKNVPVIGSIRAGEPLLVMEETTEYIPFPQQMIPSGDVFFVNVHGDSMIDEHIYDGDLALCQKTESVDDYTIAAVLVDSEEVTLKKVHYTDGHVALLPANDKYRGNLYRESELTILGKFLYAIRRPRNGK